MFGINLRSDFLKSVVLLTSGTVIAQVINFVLSPVITRLFDSEEMGELGFFMRIVAFITAIGTARYDLAIPLPKRDQHAFQLFRLALRIALYTIFAVALSGLVYWAIEGFESRLGMYLAAVLIGSVASIFRGIGHNWAIRTKAFKRISASSIISALAMNGFRIAAGLMKFGVPGLILATILGLIVGAVLFIIDFFRVKGREEYKVSKGKQAVLAKTHREFPRVNLPHVLIDTGRELVLALILIEVFTESVFGSFDHAFRTLKLPLVVVGSAMGQAFYQKCSELANENKQIYPLVRKTVLGLAAISLLPFGVIYFFGEPIYAFVFSEEWRFSGQVAEMLVPWLMINFVASPVSTIPLVINKQKLFFYLGLLNVVIQLFGFGFLPSFFGDSGEEVLQVFRIVSWAMFVYLLAVVLVKLRMVSQFDKQR